MKWIDVLEESHQTTKTKSYKVLTKDHAILLGLIRFYPRWRKYAFYPLENTLYEEDCLRDIAQFCEESTALWRIGLRRQPVEEAKPHNPN